MRRLTHHERELYRAAAGADAPPCLVQRWPWWWRGFRGLAIGGMVLVRDADDSIVICHEVVHVAQFYAAPFTFWFRYFRELLRVGYRDNRYEREAFAVSTRVQHALRGDIDTRA